MKTQRSIQATVINMRSIKNIMIVLLLISLYSCNRQIKQQEKENIYEVLGVLIEKFGEPVPPPPPSEGKEPYFTEMQIDSIMHKEMRIGLVINKHKKELSEKEFRYLDDSTFDYSVIHNSLSNLEKVNVKEILINERFQISLLDSINSKDKRTDGDYDWKININYLTLNQNQTKALAKVGVTHSGGYICILEKINDDWKITEIKTLYIS